MLVGPMPDSSAFPERPSKADVLASSTLLNAVPAEERDVLLERAHLAFAERGETIWFHGSECDFVGLVGVGFVKMVMSSASGQELTAELMGPGQIFGLLGAVEGQGCPLSARAVCATWYLKLPKRETLAMYQKVDVLKDHLLRRTTNRLRHSHEMLARMSSGRVAERIVAILFLLAESYGRETPSGTLIDVPLTRQDIGDMAGTTVETTIRVMSKWQKEGVISTDQRHITICDRARLGRELT